MTIETSTQSNPAGHASRAARSVCPSCGKKAKRLRAVTLRALLKDEFARQIPVNDHSPPDSSGEGCQPINAETGWRFCDSPDCDVVYFSDSGETTFTESQLEVPVGVKKAAGERPLCYCFGHSVASIKQELRAKGRSDALEDIRAKMKDPGCHCEVSNPSGSCCLGSVSDGLKTAQEEWKDPSAAPVPSIRSLSVGRGEKIAKVGTVVSAIMASACCWLPLALLAVGVSGAGMAAVLEAYRPLWVVITFGFLAAAFYFTYRPNNAAAEAGEGCCAPEPVEGESCCTPPRNRRFSMMGLNKIVLWGVTVLAVGFLFFPSYVGLLFGTGKQAAVTANMNRAVFQVEGMTCEGCATTAAQAIRQVPGVVFVQISYEDAQAVVGTESGTPIPQEEILAALKKIGYRGELLTGEKPNEGQGGADRGSEGSR